MTPQSDEIPPSDERADSLPSTLLLTRRKLLGYGALMLLSQTLPAKLWAAASEASSNTEVLIEEFSADGKSEGTRRVAKIIKSDAEWRRLLPADSYRVTRHEGTEIPYTGQYNDNHADGLYRCICCDTALFDSKTKFDSRTGWPSFWKPISVHNITKSVDRTLGMRRDEISCKRCDAHLGHVFDDGPRPTGLRYCMNSVALNFVKRASGPLQTAVLAGGCFWGVQGVFQHVRGVRKVVSGYSGGDKRDAQYKKVSSGATGHAEAVQITFDPAQVTYGKLLQIFFSVAHDPTQLDRQGPDTGPQYRSAIFYTDDTQKNIAQAYIAQLDAAKSFPKPIVTRLDPLKGFYPAEDYHQDFLLRNPRHPYIVIHDLPKIDDLQRLFPGDYRRQPVRTSS